MALNCPSVPRSSTRSRRQSCSTQKQSSGAASHHLGAGCGQSQWVTCPAVVNQEGASAHALSGSAPSSRTTASASWSSSAATSFRGRQGDAQSSPLRAQRLSGCATIEILPETSLTVQSRSHRGSLQVPSSAVQAAHLRRQSADLPTRFGIVLVLLPGACSSRGMPTETATDNQKQELI